MSNVVRFATPPRVHLALVADADDAPDPERPRTRGECARVPRPCPFARCRYSLLADVVGTKVRDFFGDEDVPASASCVLDVADGEEPTLDEVGAVFGICRDGARQIEQNALRKFAHRAGVALEEYVPRTRRNG